MTAVLRAYICTREAPPRRDAPRCAGFAPRGDPARSTPPRHAPRCGPPVATVTSACRTQSMICMGGSCSAAPPRRPPSSRRTTALVRTFVRSFRRLQPGPPSRVVCQAYRRDTRTRRELSRMYASTRTRQRGCRARACSGARGRRPARASLASTRSSATSESCRLVTTVFKYGLESVPVHPVHDHVRYCTRYVVPGCDYCMALSSMRAWDRRRSPAPADDSTIDTCTRRLRSSSTTRSATMCT